MLLEIQCCTVQHQVNNKIAEVKNVNKRQTHKKDSRDSSSST